MNYTITCPIVKVNGYQIFEVEAKDKEEALQKFNNGEGEFLSEEVDITKLGEPEIEES